MELLIGCPVAARAWIIRPWFLFAEQSCEQAGVTPSYVIAARPDDNTVDPLTKCCADAGRKLTVVDLEEDIAPAQREWNHHRYAQMVAARNMLLAEVRGLAPAWFLSVDSDILLHEQAVFNLLSTARPTGQAVGRVDAVGGKCYLTKEGWSSPSYCNLINGNGMLRPDIDYVQPVEAIMAIKLMGPAAYHVDYQFHFQGEDVGWSLAAGAAGLKLLYDPRVCSKHVFDPDQLNEIDLRCGY